MQTENVLIVLFAWFETAAAPIWSQSTDKLNDFMCSNCVFSHPIWAVCHWAHIFAIPKVLTKLVKFLFISSFFVCWTVSDETFPFRYACKKLYHDLQTYLFDLKSPFIHPILCLRKVYLSPDLRLHMPKKIILKHFAIAVVSPECLPLPAGSKTCLMLSTKRNFLLAVFSSYLRPKNDQSKLSEWAISSECK